jgi:hypothetical protein
MTCTQHPSAMPCNNGHLFHHHYVLVNFYPLSYVVKIHLDIIPFRNFGPSISDACPLARCKSMTETRKYQNNNEETHGEEKDGHDR